MIDLIIKISQYLQGKGFGSSTLKSEVLSTRKFLNGGVFIDVGANHGLYSKELLKQYGSSLQELHLFEPSKALVEKYLTYDDPRVFVNNIALSDVEGNATLYKVNNNSGLSSLTKRRLDHFKASMSETESIRTITLDQYVNSSRIKKIDLLKIDVEGHELNGLKGAIDCLSNNKIKCIQFEFGGCNIDTRTFFQDFWYLLSVEYGYKIFRINPFGISLVEKYQERDEVFVTTNFLAVKLDK